MWDHGVVLCENGKDDGCWAGGEVVEQAGCEGPEKKGQDGWRQDARQEVGNDEEGLQCGQYAGKTSRLKLPLERRTYGIFPRSP